MIIHDQELISPHLETKNESQTIKTKVTLTRQFQKNRQGCLNVNLSPKHTESVCCLGTAEQEFLHLAVQRLKLSARAYHRLLKVARTIADIKQENNVTLHALQQALSFKQTLQAPK